MASTPRDFKAHVPIIISFRFAFRLDLFRHSEALVKLLMKLLARWSWSCRVVVLGVAIRSNHCHILCYQLFDEHRPTEGVAAMMRNVLSALAFAANQIFSHQGRVIERTYRSHNLPTLGDLLRQYAYIHSQDAHHHSTGGTDSSQTVFDADSVDGLVTQLPYFPGIHEPGMTEQQYADAFAAATASITVRALALEAKARADSDIEQPDQDPGTRARTSNPWLQALLEVAGEELGLPLDVPCQELYFRGVMARSGPLRFLAARTALLSYRLPEFDFQARRPPHVGDIIDIRVTQLAAESRLPDE